MAANFLGYFMCGYVDLRILKNPNSKEVKMIDDEETALRTAYADEETALRYAIEEAFAGDFTSLKERFSLENAEIEEVKKLRANYFLQFEATVKAQIAMKSKDQK